MAKAGARIATALAWSGLLATSGAQPGPFLDFYGKDGKLYANGKEFKVKGPNWFGQESKQRVPYGLWERPLTELLDFVAENGFNTLRFFISLQNVAENLPTPRHFDTEDSQELVGTDFIGMVQAIARRAAERGILLLLANHQVRNGYPDDWPGKWDGTWFDDEFDEERVLQIWTQLAESFCTDAHWNVMGVDIMNEPYDLQWDVWAAAANRIGNHVLKHCPRWLIFVEGTGNEPPADPGMEWGENMIGVRHKRIRLSNDSKLVYSPHVYGPGLFEANNLAEPEYMGRPGFPGSCRAVWDRHFGYVRDLTKRPLIIGETGGHFRGRDREWQQEMVRWSVEKGFGLIYFGEWLPRVVEPTGLGCQLSARAARLGAAQLSTRTRTTPAACCSTTGRHRTRRSLECLPRCPARASIASSTCQSPVPCCRHRHRHRLQLCLTVSGMAAPTLRRACARTLPQRGRASCSGRRAHRRPWCAVGCCFTEGRAATGTKPSRALSHRRRRVCRWHRRRLGRRRRHQMSRCSSSSPMKPLARGRS